MGHLRDYLTNLDVEKKIIKVTDHLNATLIEFVNFLYVHSWTGKNKLSESDSKFFLLLTDNLRH